MTTTNTRPLGTFVAFPVKVNEDNPPTGDEETTGFGTFVMTTSKLLKVTKGELMTQEIETDPAEVAALRRARKQVREGRIHGQDELDKRISEQE